MLPRLVDFQGLVAGQRFRMKFLALSWPPWDHSHRRQSIRIIRTLKGSFHGISEILPRNFRNRTYLWWRDCDISYFQCGVRQDSHGSAQKHGLKCWSPDAPMDTPTWEIMTIQGSAPSSWILGATQSLLAVSGGTWHPQAPFLRTYISFQPWFEGGIPFLHPLIPSLSLSLSIAMAGIWWILGQ